MVRDVGLVLGVCSIINRCSGGLNRRRCVTKGLVGGRAGVGAGRAFVVGKVGLVVDLDPILGDDGWASWGK